MAEETSEWGGMYIRFMIEDSWDKTNLIRSNMDFCMTEIKSEAVNESIWKVQNWVLLGQNHVH